MTMRACACICVCVRDILRSGEGNGWMVGVLDEGISKLYRGYETMI